MEVADNMKMGRQITTTFQPDTEILAILKERAEYEDRSLGYMINYYLRKALASEGLIEPKEKPKKSKN